jgi:hypothetical protein
MYAINKKIKIFFFLLIIKIFIFNNLNFYLYKKKN